LPLRSEAGRSLRGEERKKERAEMRTKAQVLTAARGEASDRREWKRDALGRKPAL